MKIGFIALTALGLAGAPAPLCRADESVTAEGRVLIKEVEEAIRRDSTIAGREDAAHVLQDISARLKAVDPCETNSYRLADAVRAVEDFASHDMFQRWCTRIPESAWKIRIAALAWQKAYLNRYRDAAPEDRRSPRQKKSATVFWMNMDYHRWEWGYSRALTNFQHHIKRVYTDTEDDMYGYTDEFRAKCVAGIEKAIGRPLTDDDLFCKADVFRRREERKRRAHDARVRAPHDGGDVLPHPFNFLGCTLGMPYDLRSPGGKDGREGIVQCWYENFKIDSYFGKVRMTVKLAPRSKVAYSVQMDWWGQKTRQELFELAKAVKSDIEKRLMVALGEFFYEDGKHVCDEAGWWSGESVGAISRSVFGPVRIELEAADKPRNLSPSRRFRLEIVDTAVEAQVDKERKENPLKYDREAKKRRHEKLMEYGRRKARERNQGQETAPRGRPPTTSP